MSQLSFLVNPEDLGLTSCLRPADLEIIEPQELIDIVHELMTSDPAAITSKVRSGKMFLNVGSSTHTDINDSYTINSMWNLDIVRVDKDLYAFYLRPLNIEAISAYKTGLMRFARKYFDKTSDLDIWVRYQWITKVFYLQEFANVLNDPAKIEAMKVYTTLFSKLDYSRWIEEYNWDMPGISFIYRKYLKIQLNSHLSKIRTIRSSANDYLKR